VEEEAASRSGWTGEGAIVGGEDARDIGKAHVAAANVEHGSDEIADHVVEEAVAAHAIDEQMEDVCGLFGPFGGEDGPDGRARLNLDRRGVVAGSRGEVGIGGGEAAEVALPDEGRSGVLQDVEIYSPGIGVDVTRKEGRADLAGCRFDGEDAVLVCLGASGMPCMKGVRDNVGVENANGGGKGAVESANEVGGWNSRLQGEAGDLGERVHASIGTAGALG